MDAIAKLAHDAEQLRALRDVKDLHRRYAHEGVLGRWDRVADLFAADAVLREGDLTAAGREEILSWLRAQPGANGIDGAFRAEFVDEPIAHLSPAGNTALVRWSSLALSADGDGGTGITGGVYENAYRLTDEGWRIAEQVYFPQFSGDHEHGWTNIDGEDLPLVPFHFTVEETGIPLPGRGAPARDQARVLSPGLTTLIDALEDENAVRNLVHAYGYYVDRRMWTDVVDLFAEDARVDLSHGGFFHGHDGVRAAMETMGAEGLREGHLNDRPLFDTLVRMLPGGRATTRSIELGMIGDSTRSEASWEVRVLTTHCRVRDGIWLLDDLRIERLLLADYFRGWGRGEVTALSLPDADDPLADPQPGRPATEPSAAGAATRTAEELRARLDRALAYDGVENVSSAYGYYIDDFQWPQMAALFAENGNKQSPFAGYYVGRERITAAATSFWGAPPETRPGISYHWRTQPVISISEDGRSASFRVRLFQPRTNKVPSRQGDFYAAGFHSGMYPNDQAVLEDGRWQLWSLTIDEPYFVSLDWKGGWASVPPADGENPPRPSRLMELYPPDIPMTDLGRRAEHFRGGTGTVLEWPAILPMWFHYRNPVSGRVPELFWPDCVTCEIDPRTSMTAHGYQLPPDGPVPAP